MIFEWPVMLWALAVIPIMVAAYIAVVRHRRKLALQYANWLPASAAAPTQLRKAIPPLLYLFSAIALVLALARPVAVLTLVSLRDTVILAIDVSHSMQAEDMAPSRLAAAQKAAREFIDAQPLTTQIGVVAFAGTALAIQRPTTDRVKLMKAVERLQTQPGTAIGSALLVGLKAAFPKENFEIRRTDADGKPVAEDDDSFGPPPPPPIERAPGEETSAAIVLLTDGQATDGPDPVEAAEIAANRGVRVFTVGIGTEPGEVVKVDGVSMRVKLDEATLKKIADLTLGRHFLATDTENLSDIYKGLDVHFAKEQRETEIGAFLIAAAAAATLLAAALSLLWFNRVL
ncbi:MAG: VWA domain-containing protein [Rhodobacteraceae bacterium]|nr:VWA domain-containing protein [Paracoccaceae bacterium]